MSEVQNVRSEDLSFDKITATVREGLTASLEENDPSSRPLISQYARSVSEALGSVAGLVGLIRERDERIERLLKRIAGLEEAMRTLEEQSTITSDRLTGLLHSAHFLSMFDREFSESRRYGRPLSLLLIDLDSFGAINKTYGYLVGNKVLENVAKTLKDCCRESDLICRYGGEEFAVALPQTDAAGARFAAERVRLAISELSIADQQGQPIRQLTASVSYETIRPTDLTSFAILDRAHRTLAQLREEGCNRSGGVLFAPSLEEERFQGKVFRETFLKAIEEMASLAAKRDGYEDRPSFSEVAIRLGKELGLEESQLECLAEAVDIHDVGKIGIPESVLGKKGPLDENEWKIVRTHPAAGDRILRAGKMEHLSSAVFYHHENWDGSGYPDGLAGEEIPILARILTVIDAYRAMSSDRPYRPALPEEETRSRLREAAGTQFDPKIVEAMIRLMDQDLIRIEGPTGG